MTTFAPELPLPPPHRSTTQSLMLDSQIRDWVVLPLLLIMIIAGLLRSNIGKYLRPAPKPMPSGHVRAKSALMRSARLRSGAGGFLTRERWEARRLAWSARGETAESRGWLRQEAAWAETETKRNDTAENSNANLDIPGLPPGMGDPAAMMDGMKGNMAAMVQNMVMMQGISHFFRGFVLVRVPFPLTRGFKHMFQRGLYDLNTLDTSYVSSVSWYFLVMFGLRAFFRLAMGQPLQEEVEGYEIQKGMGYDYGSGVPGGPNAFDASKALKAEADNLELLTARSRRFNVEEAEKSLLGKRYPKLSKKVAMKKGEDVLFGVSFSGSDKEKALMGSQKKKHS